MALIIFVRFGQKHIAHVTGPEHFEAVKIRRDGWQKITVHRQGGKAVICPVSRRTVGRGSCFRSILLEQVGGTPMRFSVAMTRMAGRRCR